MISAMFEILILSVDIFEEFPKAYTLLLFFFDHMAISVFQQSVLLQL